ncbi:MULTISPECIES: TM2 domain-containing protein [Microbacterium]|uniref:TM2 domain-containing protein n=1 Tax=Microbacterium TaxID=33882 RepID=UPI00146DCCA5|nr:MULTISPECIES: TM2 domain-containing protein [Microbacterium]
MATNLSPQTAPPQAPFGSTAPPERSFIATWMFSWLLGFLGVDRFYLGKVGTGILKLLTFGGLGVWWLIDLILTLAGVQRDKEGRLLPDFEQHKMIAWIITAAGFGLAILTSALTQIFVYVPEQIGPMMPWWLGQ